MSTARYNNAYEGWILEYTDFRRVAGGKRGDRKKKIKDREFPALSKSKQRLRQAQMCVYAADLQEQTKMGVAISPVADVPVLAVDYLSRVTRFCRSSHPRTVEGARAIVKRFTNFLKLRYKDYFLHEITSDVALAYFRSISGYALSTLIKHKLTLNYVFRKVIRKMEENNSKSHYRNPFDDEELLIEFELNEDGEMRGKVNKKSFSIEQIRRILAAADGKKYPLFGNVWYLGYLTGWRLGDILGLRWEQIDFENRVITVTHQKTRRFRIKTCVYITERLFAMLQGMRNKADSEFVFPSWCKPKSGGVKFNRLSRAILGGLSLGQTETSGMRKQSLYTFHGLRGTVITSLKLRDYNQDRIDYLVGHRGRGVDPASYNRFYEYPEAATRDMLEYLDSLLYPPQA